MHALEQHFAPFRKNTVGHEQTFASPWGEQRIVYADWTASGRLYRPIEQAMLERFGPFVGNTHSESSETGRAMTLAYHEAHRILKAHVNAGPDDLILSTGTGMTGVINKFQRILGLKAPQGLRRFVDIPELERPVVFITHMEHHSNQTSWCETIADVVVVPPDAAGMIDLDALETLLHEYRERTIKIGSFSACSNVTGVLTPYHAMARLMHRAGGVAFIDFAASAPYVAIDMHPADPLERLDAVMWSPHKFLGGPGASGVLIFNRQLYQNTVPDDSGGGTVNWTNPWGEYSYLEDIEAREDAGTPGFLQTIKAALAVRLKEQMGVEQMLEREQAIVPYVIDALGAIPGVHLLAPELRHRLAMFSFYIEGIHYNLVVQLLNDRFGVQARGGCSCAGTYGHFLLHVDPTRSRSITDRIDHGDLSEKPGWVRISFHPSTTQADIDRTIQGVAEIVSNAAEWINDYTYSPITNEFTRSTGEDGAALARVKQWFELGPAVAEATPKLHARA
ncbi:MAG TPA: aminotransferase class V-fold PLP-dependent enzyme [Dokdonella sp.]|uniref:aminotransferase class V-fold PLP-dependent enzyme n=1 Tax=Dokdonella sp. TaxID=2291710 RepID=UPI002D7E3695|nr:aminotransferase class V-fold PLP-dependent enzyme [Dokdonella sp.]HET9032322.1 aminotransferase class V-fold PLP-dependent enzyme [Dokdonella sp.]